MRIKKQIQKNSYFKYLKRKHDYTKCDWCNRVIRKKDNYCYRCGKPNQEHNKTDGNELSFDCNHTIIPIISSNPTLLQDKSKKTIKHNIENFPFRTSKDF